MRIGIGRAALFAASLAVCGCASQGPLDSSGAAEGDVPVAMLSLAVNPKLSPDASAESGTNSIDPAAVEPSVAAFARNFSTDFPVRLADYGVLVRDPGRGIPVLRVYAAAYRQDCGDSQACETEVRIDGALLDSRGSRLWRFSTWLPLEQMNDDRYESFYKRLLKQMLKDQVIAAG